MSKIICPFCTGLILDSVNEYDPAVIDLIAVHIRDEFEKDVGNYDNLVSKINRAMVHIPKPFAKVKDGSAYAYSQGVLAGREDAIKIINEFKQEDMKQPLF